MPRIAFQGTQLSYKSWNFFNNVHNILHNYRIVFAANLITSTLLYAWCWIHVLVAKAKDSRMDASNHMQPTRRILLYLYLRGPQAGSSRHHHTYICDIDNKHEDHILKKVGCLWLYRYSPWFVWSWFFYKQIIHTSIKLYWFYMQPHIRIVCVLIKLNNFSCFTTSYVNKNSYTTKITLNKPILSTLLSLLIM